MLVFLGIEIKLVITLVDLVLRLLFMLIDSYQIYTFILDVNEVSSFHSQVRALSQDDSNRLAMVLHIGTAENFFGLENQHRL